MIVNIPGVGDITVAILSSRRKVFAEATVQETARTSYRTRLKSACVGPDYQIRICHPSGLVGVQFGLSDNAKSGEQCTCEDCFLLDDHFKGVDTYLSKKLTFTHAEGELVIQVITIQAEYRFVVEYYSRRVAVLAA